MYTYETVLFCWIVVPLCLKQPCKQFQRLTLRLSEQTIPKTSAGCIEKKKKKKKTDCITGLPAAISRSVLAALPLCSEQDTDGHQYTMSWVMVPQRCNIGNQLHVSTARSRKYQQFSSTAISPVQRWRFQFPQLSGQRLPHLFHALQSCWNRASFQPS